MTIQITRRDFLKLCGSSSVAAILAACGVASTPSPALTNTPLPTSTLLPSATPTLTNTPASTSTATVTVTPTATATATAKPPTLRDFADRLSKVFGTMTNRPMLQSNSLYAQTVPTIANQLVIGFELDTQEVFKQFSIDEWKKVLADWDNVSKTLNAGKIIEGYRYAWDKADYMVSFAKQNRMSIRAQHLLWGADVYKTIRDGYQQGIFKKDDMERILEFMIKTRVIKYRGQIDEWDCVDEPAQHLLYQNFDRQTGFWYLIFGSEIIDKSARWTQQADPTAKRCIVEDKILQPDTFPKQNAIFFDLLTHFKNASVPIERAGIECNFWIFRPPQKNMMLDTLRKIQELGFGIASTETSVVVGDVDPTSDFPKTVNEIKDRVAAQTAIYTDWADAYLQTGADMGVANISDVDSWYNSIKHPETQAMILDADLKPKPAYFAILDALQRYQKTK